jgi:hypothetical protein
VTFRGATIGLGMRTIAHRLTAIIIAVALGASVWAACVDATQTKARMACCAHSHNGCALGDQAADCCKTTLGVQKPFIGVDAISIQTPHLIARLPIAPSVAATATRLDRRAVFATTSPPGTKHPRFLVLSTLRL